MGDILVDFGKRMKPMVHIERRVDEVETQKLSFVLGGFETVLGTETGESFWLHGNDRKGNRVEIEIPIPVRELRDALSEYLGDSERLSYKEVTLPLQGGRHTKIYVVETPKGKIAFPEENLVIAKSEGTEETEEILRKLKLRK